MTAGDLPDEEQLSDALLELLRESSRQANDARREAAQRTNELRQAMLEGAESASRFLNDLITGLAADGDEADGEGEGAGPSGEGDRGPEHPEA